MKPYDLDTLWRSWGAHVDLECARKLISLGCRPNSILLDALLEGRYDLVFLLAEQGADLAAVRVPDVDLPEYQRARRVLPLIDTAEKRAEIRDIFLSLGEWALSSGGEQ